MPVTSREAHLIARPAGMPRPEEFAIVERTVPDPGEGQIQVQNLYLSVDPAMRPRLSALQPLNEAMAGSAIGRVVQSRNPSFTEGDVVIHGTSFCEYFVSDGRGVRKLQTDPAGYHRGTHRLGCKIHRRHGPPPQLSGKRSPTSSSLRAHSASARAGSIA